MAENLNSEEIELLGRIAIRASDPIRRDARTNRQRGEVLLRLLRDNGFDVVARPIADEGAAS